MKKFFITGATGDVAAPIVIQLLKLGYEVVCGVRAKGNKIPTERLHKMLKFTEPTFEPAPYREKLIVVNFDFLLRGCGVSNEDRLHLNGVTHVLHSAGEISFDPLQMLGTFDTNVAGLLNTVYLCQDICPDARFVDISTAYVAGRSWDGVFSEGDMTPNMEFNNRYEASKLYGEHLLAQHWENRLTIRPSIVVSERAKRPSGPIGYMGLLAQLRAHLMKRFEQLSAAGIASVDGELLNITGPYLRYGASTMLNIVPGQWITEMVVKALLSDHIPGGSVLHLVNPNPPSVKAVIERILQALQLQIILKPDEINANGLHTGTPAGDLQIAMDTRLDVFKSYRTQVIEFGDEATRKLFGHDFVEPSFGINEFGAICDAYAQLWAKMAQKRQRRVRKTETALVGA